MPELHAPAQELASYLDTNVPWHEVAEMYGYDTGRAAREAALEARRSIAESPA